MGISTMHYWDGQRKDRVKCAFDLDGVVVNTISLMVKEQNADAGTDFTLEDVTKYDLSTIGVKNPREFLKHKEYIYKGASPIKGAIEGLKELYSLGVEISFISARNFKDDLEISCSWLNRHGLNYQNIVMGQGMNKSHSCYLFGTDVFVEDNFRELQQVYNNTTSVDCLLLDQPYNRQFEELGTFRVKNWEEIVGYIKRNYLK